MRRIRQAIVALLLGAITIVPTGVLAQEIWNPFDGVSKLVEWFESLNVDFDRVVIVEKKAQLLRSVDRLRNKLYTLEHDTRTLKDNIPDESPNEDQKVRLQTLVNELMDSLTGLSSNAREIGADLRLNEGSEVEEALTYGLHVKGELLTYLQQAFDEEPWNAQEIRARLDRGLKAVRDAQVTVTAFRRKLSSEE